MSPATGRCRGEQEQPPITRARLKRITWPATTAPAVPPPTTILSTSAGKRVALVTQTPPSPPEIVACLSRHGTFRIIPNGRG